MLDTIEQTILSALQLIFDSLGWMGVFALMVFENATGITSSEIILAFAGWMLIERHGISPSFIPLAGLYAGLGSAIGAGYGLGNEWRLISDYIKTQLPLVFAAGALLSAGYLLYHYRAALRLPAWLRQNHKELE